MRFLPLSPGHFPTLTLVHSALFFGLFSPLFPLSSLSFSPFFFGCCSRFFAILGLCRDYLAPLRILLQSFLYPPTPLPPSVISTSLSLSLCLFLCSCIGSRIVLDLQRFFEILDSIFGGCTPPLVTALASRGHLGGFHLSPAASQEILHCSLEILRTRRGL